MKKLKIVRIAGLHYANPRSDFQKQATKKSYFELQQELFKKAFVYSDSFSKSMKEIGYEAFEIVYDFDLLQKTWARENQLHYTKSSWQKDILYAQLRQLKPDIVFFQDIHALTLEEFKSLKERFSFLKLVIIFRGYPGFDPDTLQVLSTADLLLVGSPTLEKKLKEKGLSPVLVYHYFDQSLLKKVKIGKPIYDFTFLGSSGYSYGVTHIPRYKNLLELLRKTNIQLWIDEEGHYNTFPKNLKITFRNFLKNLLSNISKKKLTFISKQLPFLKFKRLCEQIMEERSFFLEKPEDYPLKPISRLFPERCFKPVFGLKFYQALSRSKITFNNHTLEAGNNVDNIRLFQATGMQSCLITNRGENMPELFQEDEEVVCYSSIEECVEKVKFLLKHDEIRKKIAAQGYKRTLKDHSALNRMKKIDQLIRSRL